MVLREGDYLYNIVKYIESHYNLDYTTDEIRHILIKQGYSRSAIEKGFRIAKQNKPKLLEKNLPKKVILVDSNKESKKEVKIGFFSRLLQFFNKKPKVKEQSNLEPDETVKINSEGNLISA